jgi:hypothetical protein
MYVFHSSFWCAITFLNSHCLWNYDKSSNIYPPAQKGENGKGPLEKYNAVFGTGLAVTAPCQQVDEQHK